MSFVTSVISMNVSNVQFDSALTIDTVPAAPGSSSLIVCCRLMCSTLSSASTRSLFLNMTD